MIYLYTNYFFDEKGSGIKRYIEYHLKMLSELSLDFTLVTSKRMTKSPHSVIRVLPKKALIVLCFLNLDTVYMRLRGIKRLHDLDFSVPFNLIGSVATLHDLYPEKMRGNTGRLNYLVRRKIFKNASNRKLLLISVSNKTAEDAISLDLGNFPVITNYLPRKFWNIPLNNSVKRGVLILGRIEHRKNLVSAILAYSCLPKNIRIEHPLHIIGPPGNAKLQDFLSRQFVDDQISILFHGYVDENQLLKLMTESKALLLPSICEGFGYPVYEAIANGLNVVSSIDIEFTTSQSFSCDYSDIHSISDQIKLALTGTVEKMDYYDEFRLLEEQYYLKYQELYGSIF